MEWISVKDRLPKHEQDVDILLNTGFRRTDVMYIDNEEYHDSTEGKHFFSEFGSFDISEVSHWMPLPEPPQ